MRPRLKPVLRLVERDGRTLQFGIHPLRAVVLTDVEPAVRRLIGSLDGTRTLEQVVTESELGEDAATQTIAMLAAHGLIEDAAAPTRPLAGLSLAERDRLRPDLGRLALTSADGGMAALAVRRAARVRIYGAGRVGAQVAVLLAAAGVGHICVVDPGIARPEDVVPGGLSGSEVGMPREDGAIAAAERIAPGVDARPGRAASRPADRACPPDLAILAPVGPLDPVLVRELTAEGIPHLLATAFEGHGFIGPLVVPGLTPCLRCLDFARADRDPGWPMVSARLGGYPAGEIACDTILATLVAAQAAGRALGYLEDGTVPAGVLDVSPDWQWRHRSWEPHPHCGCSRDDMTSLTMVG